MNIKKILPTFICVGAARSGTTSLYNWLKQHPQIFMSPIKETNFFATEDFQPPFKGPGDEIDCKIGIERKEDGTIKARYSSWITSLEEYLELFKGSESYSARGEISNLYLYSKGAALRIRKLIPDCKIIILLRNPVERAFSNYVTLVLAGREKKSFEKALKIEEKRIEKGYFPFWAYKNLGLYSEQVKRYLDVFPKEQVGIWLFEDLVTRPVDIFKEICRFIDVEDSFVPDDISKRYNVSTREIETILLINLGRNVYWRTLTSLLPSYIKRFGKQIFRKLIKRRTLEIKPEIRKYLLEFYKKDILKLNELLPELDVMRWITDENFKLLL